MLLNLNALAYLWAKLKATFALIDHSHADLEVTINQLTSRIATLEAQITALENSKQDKIETWGDLAE